MLTVSGHVDAVLALAFAPGGSLLASAGYDGAVRVWDAGGRCLADLRTDNPRALAVAFSPDGTTLAAGFRFAPGAAYGNICLWRADPDARRPEFAYSDTWRSHDSDCRTLAFSPDGGKLATGGSDGTVRLWDLAGQRELTRLRASRGAPRVVAFGPDGRRLAALGGVGSPVRVWSLPAVNHETVWADEERHGHALAFAPEGSALAVACGERVYLWELSAATPALLGEHAESALSVAFAPDGRTLMSAGSDGVVKVWDRAGRYESAAFDWGAGELMCVAFSPHGLTAAAGTRDGAILLWDVE